MKESNHFLDELEDFLGGTFHQDINSPEQALDEFINEVSKEILLATISDCEKFLDSQLTIHQKENFIQENTEIYFEAINLLPTQWLKNMIIHMKEAVKTK